MLYFISVSMPCSESIMLTFSLSVRMTDERFANGAGVNEMRI